MKAGDANILAIVKRNLSATRPIIVMFWLLLLVSVNNLAQEFSPLAFKRYTVDDGLPQNMARCIYQDSTGFVWIGTASSLARFDGVKWKIFGPNLQPNEKPLEGEITSFVEDGLGHIWMMGHYGSLSVYNKKTGFWMPAQVYVKNCPAKFGTAEGENAMHKAADGSIIVWANATGQGVYRIDPKGKQCRKIIDLPKNDYAWNNAFTSPDSLVWVLQNNRTTLSAYSLAGKNVKNFEIPEMPVFQSFFHNGSTLYLGGKHRIVTLNRQTGQIIDRYFPDNPRYSSILSFARDSSTNRLYFLAGNQISCISLPNGEISTFPDSDSYKMDAYCLFINNTCGSLWITTTGSGVYCYNLNSLNLHKEPRLGNNNFGMYVLQHEVKKWFKGRPVPPFRHQINPIAPLWLAQLTDSTWFMTNGIGVDHLFKAGKNVANYLGPRHKQFYRVFQPPDGSIWFSTDSGIYKQGAEKQFRIPRRVESLDERVTCLLPEKDSALWYLTQAQGLYYHHFPSGKSRVYFINNAWKSLCIQKGITCIASDPIKPEKYLWVSTWGKGLLRMEKKTGKSILLGTEQGLNNLFIYGFLADDMGNLWCSSNGGLFVINTGSFKIIHLTVKDGLQSNEFNSNEFYKARDGKMYFGGIAGYNSFYPRVILKNIKVPQFFFTHITSWESNSRTAIKRDWDFVNGTEPVTLSANENNLEIAFGSPIPFSELGYSVYCQVNDAPSLLKADHENSFLFYNLSPGTYKFSFKVLGMYQPNLQFTIKVLPPWYYSWPAIICYIIALGIIIIWLFHNRLSKIRLKLEADNAGREIKKAQTAREIQTGFFFGITHDLRNPLTLIINPLENLYESNGKNYQKHEIEVAIGNAQRLLSLTEQLLDKAKLEMGLFSSNIALGCLYDFMAGIAETQKFAALEKQVGILLTDKTGNLACTFDFFNLGRVIENVLNNALKYSPARTNIGITISAANNNHLVKTTITDQGPGMEESELKQVFTPFYKGTHAKKGAGLGLFICYEIMQKLGGKISIESQVGKGTTVTIEWPVEPIVVDMMPPKILIDNRRPDDNEPENPENSILILVADDNQTLCRYLAQNLYGAGYEVITAFDGAEAIHLIETRIPDIVVSDIIMPLVTGREIASFIRNNQATNHIDIILITALTGSHNLMEGLKTGADAYMAKPFSINELLLRVKNLLDKRRSIKNSLLKSINQPIPKQEPEKTGSPQVEMDIFETNNTFINKARQIILDNMLNEQFGAEILADELGLSLSQLNRKLTGLLGFSTSRLIRRIKVNHAQTIIANNPDMLLGEVAYLCGFKRSDYLTKAFKEEMGHGPKEKA